MALKYYICSHLRYYTRKTLFVRIKSYVETKKYISKRKRYNKNTFISLQHILNKKIYNSVCMILDENMNENVLYKRFIFMYIKNLPSLAMLLRPRVMRQVWWGTLQKQNMVYVKYWYRQWPRSLLVTVKSYKTSRNISYTHEM